MDHLSRRILLLVLFCLLLPGLGAADRGDDGDSDRENDDEPLPTVAEKTAEMERRAGFFTFYVDERRGKVWLELPPPAGEGGEVATAIYVNGLRQGLGSNPIGLDRGQIQDSRLIRIRRLGPRVLFEQPNLGYRALSEDRDEIRATRESFATSVIWGAEAGALDGDGRALVDLTSLLIRDAHGVAATLREAEQGEFELDPERSAVDLPACLVFPDNVELEALLTFQGRQPGGHVRDTVPTPDAITLVHHHSLVRLPDEGYRPRRFDPRMASFGIRFLDYAAPLDQAIATQWIARHRLEKTDPAAARSRVREPIVYYVDRGAPEPVRSALVEGASWWAEAFEKAGFVDAYRVELLPEDAHPLDVRYNVIQWVHRSTRGWSYGNAVTDPRSGEIVKGQVSLGSLRVRQDRLIFEGLLGTEKTGSGAADDPIELSLARIRQLAAHEVGHTLGFTHNFAASTYDGRASVMDYPAPLVGVTPAGELDVTGAYGVGVGSWDLASVRYAYSQFAPGADEDAELARIVAETVAAHTFVADADARPPSGSDPRGNLWDNGVDAAAELERALAVRRTALARFGERNLPRGRPLAELEEVLAPVYFHHRYQLDAAVKAVGGMEVDYAVKGDGRAPTRIVDGARQRRALAALLSVLEPASLDLPEGVLALLAPRPFGFERHRELFASSTWPAFDALGAAATAADDVVEALVEPARLGRLADFHRRDPSLPGVGEVLGALVDAAFAGTGDAPRHAALRRVVQRTLVDRLIAQASRPELRGDLRGELEWALEDVRRRLAGGETAHAAALTQDVRRFLEREWAAPVATVVPADPPPGSPIGAGDRMGCGGFQ
jgi:hypothetical protein